MSVSPSILDIERASSAKLLVIRIYPRDFEVNSCDTRVKHIITIASQRLHITYDVKTTRPRPRLLHGVFCALIVNKIIYAISDNLFFYVKVMSCKSIAFLSVPSNSVM